MKERYSIGDMSRICNISRKALRYYDQIGLITPQRQDYNNYRYYTRESLLLVPVLKYYKQMGFTLDEMRSSLDPAAPNVYRLLRLSFQSKIDELKRQQADIQRKLISVKDWNDLIQEAEMVLENDIREVSVKYVEPMECVFLEQRFDGDLKAAIINIEFTNYLEELGNEVTGPVILNFSSIDDRIRGTEQPFRIMQKTILELPEAARAPFGGRMMATRYHIGAHETIADSYASIRAWAAKHGYALGAESFERYVTDYWTTGNRDHYVTEIMVGVSRPGSQA